MFILALCEDNSCLPGHYVSYHVLVTVIIMLLSVGIYCLCLKIRVYYITGVYVCIVVCHVLFLYPVLFLHIYLFYALLPILIGIPIRYY